MTPAEVTSVRVLPERWLRLRFADGAVIEVDAKPLVAGGGVFAHVEADDAVFERVRVASGTISWPGGVDVCPDVLYGRGEPADGTRFERRVVDPGHGSVA
ncbi:MAG TPA: DUF2442 domain-containing protein [Conexibacter sp.]|nr:DUF2442 domain-containing protein [Conexibacter sp.]